MRKAARLASLLAAMLLAIPASVRAQGVPNLGMPMMPMSSPLSLPNTDTSGLGSVLTPQGQALGSSDPQQQNNTDTPLSVTDSFVCILDSALPRNLLSVGFDAYYDIRQPMRAEYLFAKGGVPGSAGFPFPETKIDYQEANLHAEYAFVSFFSFFAEGSYRWVNPDINANERGFGPSNFGFKLCTWNSDSFIATILFRAYQPPTDPYTLGNNHWSVEPGLLAAWQISDKFLLEGDVRYWAPIGGSDFAGDIVRYGLGLSYGKRNPNGFWFTPVAECVGWTVLNGKTMIATSPDSYLIENARNETIANGYLGIRLGWSNIDFYVGYGRCFTGDQWQRDFYRAQLRFCY